MSIILAELISTYALVFFGTGAIIVNELNSVITHLGIAIAFGAVVTVMIFAFGGISGAQMNPAVSLAFFIRGDFSFKILIKYLAGQLIGGVLASFSLAYLFQSEGNLGASLPQGTWHQSFILEFILTFFLMLVILRVIADNQIKSFAALAIGTTVMIEALVGGPTSGASMNPIRSLAPALVSGELQYLWIYLIAPPLGAILAVLIHPFLSKKTDEFIS